jgi:hypothetical protein
MVVPVIPALGRRQKDHEFQASFRLQCKTLDQKKKPTKIISYYFSSFNGFGFFPILSNKIEQHIFEQLMGH